MGTRGPISNKSKPPTLRLVQDEDQQPGTIPVSQIVKPTAPERPEDLRSDLWALWDLVSGELDSAGLLAKVDGPALHLALLHYQAAVDAARELHNEGSVVPGAMGGSVKNPASQVFKENTAAFTELSKQLGLTFAARARISVPEGKFDAVTGNPFSAAPIAG